MRSDGWHEVTFDTSEAGRIVTWDPGDIPPTFVNRMEEWIRQHSEDHLDGPGITRWMRVYDGECELRDFRDKSIKLGFGDPWPDQSDGKFKRVSGDL